MGMETNKVSKKKDVDYFKELVRAAEYAEKASKILEQTFEQYDPTLLSVKMKDMHAVEHAADIAKHEMMQCLVRAFITPIEREDIMELSQNIDDVTDAIEDVLMRAYMFNITSIREEALEFTKVIVRCCEAMNNMMLEFHNFRKSSSIYEHIVEMNRMEEEGDALYLKAVRKIYTTSQDPIELMIWREMFDRMEKCCDACEHVANVVESVIMKNS